MNWNHWKKLPFCLLVAGLTSGCFEAQWEKEVAETSSDAKVSASDLCKAFGMDKSSANQSYKGKVIEVYGKVQETWAEGERTMVVLSGGDLEVRCLVSQLSEPDLADLKVGRPTLVKGKCRGLVKGDIALGGCIIQDPLRGLKAKARSGDMSAQFDLAKSLSTAPEGMRDVRRSFQLYCKAAEKGHAEAKATVMKALAGAWSPETNSPVIWQWLREEAEDGNAEACYLLGMLYNVDEDFGIDPKASVPWFKKASDKGHQEAMFTMAMFNYNGELVPTNKTESARLLSKVDAKTLPRASEVLGIMTLNGDGIPVDVPKGLSLLETAALNGRSHSAGLLGTLYERDGLVSRDAMKSLDWFLKAAEMGDAYGQVKAGLMLRDSSEVNSEKRSRNLIFAALSNDQQVAYSAILSYTSDLVEGEMSWSAPDLKTNGWVGARRINGTLIRGEYAGLGNGVLNLKVATNLVSVPLAEFDVEGRQEYDPEFRQLLSRSFIMEQAINLVQGFIPPKTAEPTNGWKVAIRTMAEEGDPYAQALLGSDLLAGTNTVQEGLDWLKKSAEAGSSNGQNAMGMVYLRGIGQPADKAAAFRMFNLAADQGDPESLFISGRMLLSGEGCEKDVAGGLGLIKRSVDAGENQALLFLGRYYYGDRNGSRDAAQAFAWFRLGAVMGMPECQYWLGRMYYEGNGLPKDYNRAIQWLTQSASQGYRPAVDLLNSDAYQKEEIAKAKAAYQQELARHAKELERIKTNPKYDTVICGKIPSFFRANEKEAYLRFADNYMKGRFGRNIARCADEAYRYVGSGGTRRSSGSGKVMVVKGDTSDKRWLEGVQGYMMGYNEMPSGAEARYIDGYPSSYGNYVGSGGGRWNIGGISGGGMGSMMDASMRAFMNRWTASGGQ